MNDEARWRLASSAAAELINLHCGDLSKAEQFQRFHNVILGLLLLAVPEKRSGPPEPSKN